MRQSGIFVPALTDLSMWSARRQSPLAPPVGARPTAELIAGALYSRRTGHRDRASARGILTASVSPMPFS